VASFCWLVAGAFAGFSHLTIQKPQCFLGDAGSHLAGYLLAVIAILPHFYSEKYPVQWAVITPLIVLAVHF
jgi:UDP-N-acetylmuramyl pentapeptide phosphotransferase/UDP-N-acetylglucosamine-1-phosphate transferase